MQLRVEWEGWGEWIFSSLLGPCGSGGFQMDLFLQIAIGIIAIILFIVGILLFRSWSLINDPDKPVIFAEIFFGLLGGLLVLLSVNFAHGDTMKSIQQNHEDTVAAIQQDHKDTITTLTTSQRIENCLYQVETKDELLELLVRTSYILKHNLGLPAFSSAYDSVGGTEYLDIPSQFEESFEMYRVNKHLLDWRLKTFGPYSRLPQDSYHEYFKSTLDLQSYKGTLQDEEFHELWRKVSDTTDNLAADINDSVIYCNDLSLE